MSSLSLLFGRSGLFSVFVLLFINFVMMKQTRNSRLCSPFPFYEIGTRADANIHKAFACRYLSNNICTGCLAMDPWLLFPRMLLFTDTLLFLERVGSEGVAARSWVTWRKLHWSPFEHWPFICPLVTGTFSSFNANSSLSTLDHGSRFNSAMPGVKVS